MAENNKICMATAARRDRRLNHEFESRIATKAVGSRDTEAASGNKTVQEETKDKEHQITLARRKRNTDKATIELELDSIPLY